ncbi:MAG: hypothetical protein JSS49_16395 [Planctomycetes bacterium]|nr:hypothetical protein [Planctomycetota bacterium]
MNDPWRKRLARIEERSAGRVRESLDRDQRVPCDIRHKLPRFPLDARHRLGGQVRPSREE